MVVPRFVKAALRNEPITIYGDGNQTRVFCHASDAILGLISLLSHPESVGEVFNIGGVGEISIFDLAENIVKITNSTSAVVTVPYIPLHTLMAMKICNDEFLIHRNCTN